MAEPDAPPPEIAVLDEFGEKLRMFHALRTSDEAAANRVLSELGGRGNTERDIIDQLAAPTPIRQLDRFDEAQRLVVHAIEVLRRNGWRGPRLPRNLGPLNPIAKWLVQLFARLIVQNHITRLVDNLRNLYSRREAWAVPGSEELRQLRRARIHAQRIAPDFKGRALGLPSFLLGGAIISSGLGVLRAGASAVRSNRALVVTVTVALLVLLLAVAWCVLRGAAVARNRIHLTTEQPMRALYEVIGYAGRPPKDDAFKFALIALIGMALAWVVIPVGVILVVT
ncbi:MAG: hypothetical protein RL219_2555 [Actinomycetota bacterium]